MGKRRIYMGVIRVSGANERPFGLVTHESEAEMYYGNEAYPSRQERTINVYAG